MSKVQYAVIATPGEFQGGTQLFLNQADFHKKVAELLSGFVRDLDVESWTFEECCEHENWEDFLEHYLIDNQFTN